MDQPILKVNLRGAGAMRDVMRNANTYYTQNMDHPPFLDATDADIDAAPCAPKTRARLKRCLVLRDQINHYLPPQAGFFLVGQQTIDLAHKEIIEELRKVLDAGPVEVRQGAPTKNQI